MSRRNSNGRTADDEPITRLDDQRAGRTCGASAADDQLVDLAGAWFIRRDWRERGRDQNSLGRRRNRCIGGVDRLGKCVGEVLARNFSLLLL